MYDSSLGRFISADIFIQAPDNSQSFNRYSYVLNNPMKYSDPSGHFFKKLFKKIGKFVKKYWRSIVAIAVAVVAPYAAPFVAGFLGVSAAVSVVITGAIAGAIGGAIIGRSWKAALIGGVSGAMFGALHGIDAGGGILSTEGAFKVMAHGVAGGLSSIMQGGKFGDGFLSAGVMQAVSIGGVMGKLGATGPGVGNRIYSASVSAVIGGTVSELTGGKFKNGAVSGAWSRLLNDTAMGGGKGKTFSEKMSDAWKLAKGFWGSGHAYRTASNHFDNQNDWKHASNKTKADALGFMANRLDNVATGCLAALLPCAGLLSLGASVGSLYYDQQEYGNLNVSGAAGLGYGAAAYKAGGHLSGKWGVAWDSAANVMDFLFDTASERR